MRNILVAALAVALAIPLVGAVVPSGPGRWVKVYDFGFEDQQSGDRYTVVSVGTTVTWDFSANAFPHTAEVEHSVNQGGLDTVHFNSGTMPGKIPPGSYGSTYSTTFTTPGVIEYRCHFHYPGMTGVIVVTA